jgi:TonB family protein
MEQKPKNFIQNPTFPGGTKGITEFIYKHLRYPKLAVESKLEGVVVLRYDIDNQGVVKKVQVLKSLGLGCDEEAIRVVKMMRFDMPTNRGLRVTFHKNIRVQFKMLLQQVLEMPPKVPVEQPQIQYSIVSSAPEVKKEVEKPASIVYSIIYTA